jgi:hypothetical protein
VTEKVDKYDAINKSLIKSQLSEEIGKYDTENRKAIRTIFTEELQKYDTANKEILHSIIDEELAKKTASIDESHRVLVASEIAKSQEETKKLLNEQLSLREASVKQYVVEELAKNAGPPARIYARSLPRRLPVSPKPAKARQNGRTDSKRRDHRRSENADQPRDFQGRRSRIE